MTVVPPTKRQGQERSNEHTRISACLGSFLSKVAAVASWSLSGVVVAHVSRVLAYLNPTAARSGFRQAGAITNEPVPLDGAELIVVFGLPPSAWAPIDPRPSA